MLWRARVSAGGLLLVLQAVVACTNPKRDARPESSPPSSSIPSGQAMASASPPAPPPSAQKQEEKRVSLSLSGGKSARSARGMVVSVEDHATRAGVTVLERGGNAVDAAVAVGYALAVTHPSAGNIGGGGFMLVHPAGTDTVAIDFRERAPLAITQERFDRMIENDAVGPAAVGVPGTVAGLNLAQRRFGKLELSDVMAPAIQLAEKGFPLRQRQAKTIGWAWPRLRRDPAARVIFGRKGKPLSTGQRLVQPDLGKTLRRIAERGDRGFYEGETASALAQAMKAGGVMTTEDLSAYRARERVPLRIRYRGLDVEIAPPPSAGGVAVAQMLLMREALHLFDRPRASASELHLFVETARRAHATRRFDVVDPDSVAGYDLEAKKRDWFDVEHLLDRKPRIDPDHATPSKDVHPFFEAAMRELEHTTHFSVADAEGNVVACTTTLSAGFGARFVAGRTGIVMNNSLAAFGTVGADVLAPGRRMTSSMSPTLVLDGDRVILVLGSPGGDTIPNTVVQVFRNVVDYGLPLDQAIEAPRFHHGFVPDEIRYERSRPLDAGTMRALTLMGHRFSKKTINIGDANDLLSVNGILYGHADEREGGLALGPQPASSPTP